MAPNNVVFICPVYNNRPIIIESLLEQSHKNWNLLLIHDGPNDKSRFDVRRYVDFFADNRVTYLETEARQQQYGHPLRKMSLEKIKSGEWFPGCDFIVITNNDNYHCPAFCSKLVDGFDPETVMTYCGQMVHNYFDYATVPITFQRARIDIAACMIRRHIACDVGWKSMEHSSDWYFLDEIRARYGSMNGISIRNFKQVPGCLVVHN